MIYYSNIWFTLFILTMYAPKDVLYIRKHTVSSCQEDFIIVNKKIFTYLLMCPKTFFFTFFLIVLSFLIISKNSNILLIYVLRCTWLLGIIRFDAANIRWLFRHEDLHQFHQAVFKLSGRLWKKTREAFLLKNHIKKLKDNGERVSHHLWPFLVDHFLSVEALPQDLVVRLAHDLSRDKTTQPHVNVSFPSNSHFKKLWKGRVEFLF